MLECEFPGMEHEAGVGGYVFCRGVECVAKYGVSDGVEVYAYLVAAPCVGFYFKQCLLWGGFAF